MNNITFEEVKDILKCSIDETTNGSEAIERTLQHIYLKGWNDAANEYAETEKESDCNEKLINEYISKVGCCDECFASTYCTVNGLRESRVPQGYCARNIKRYFGDNANPTDAESEDEE